MTNIVDEAHDLYQDSLDALHDQRKQIEEDIRFSDPSDPDQWDPDIKFKRLNDPGGVRPCLVIDQTGQYVSNVAGQVEKSPPATHAIPVGGGADKKAAEQIDGRFRHIEHESRAQQHYKRAETSAARVGVGYLVVRPCIIDKALNYQEPRISSEPDALKVICDPWSVELDGCDMDFGFIRYPISLANFERKWPKHDAKDFGDLETQQTRDERKSVFIAEQWHKVTEIRHMCVYLGEDGEQKSATLEEYGNIRDAQGFKPELVGDPIAEKYQCVYWRIMSGVDVLETLKDKNGKEIPFPSDYIGIVPVYGYVGFKDGRMNYCGIPRRARVPQQAYNYHCSEMLSYIGTAPKSPWIASLRAISGHETLWDRASVDSRAVLPFNDHDEFGAIAAPTRTPLALDFRNHETGAARALRDIQASIGMYQANIGANSNVTSGVAYDAQKEQGEASTAHFPSHLSDSVGQVGRIVMQMDAKLTDTRREQPIIGIDLSPGKVMVDPAQKEAFMRQQNGVSINPTVGKYGVRVVVGASFATQRKETNTAFTEMMRGNKEMVPVMAPFWAQTLDFPGSDKFAQAMVAMAPPAVKAIMQPEGMENEADPAQLKQENEQLKQALQEAIQHAHEAQADADKAEQEKADIEADHEAQEQEVKIKAFQANTERIKVLGANEEQIKVLTQQTVEEMLSQREPLAGEDADENGDAIMPQQQGMEAPQEQGVGTPEPDTRIEEVLQGQEDIKNALMQLIELTQRKRVKTPERDKSGLIIRVTDQLEEPQTETLQ